MSVAARASSAVFADGRDGLVWDEGVGDMSAVCTELVGGGKTSFSVRVR